MDNQRRQQQEEQLRPMSQEELTEKLNQSEDDIRAGRVHSQSAVEALVRSHRKKGEHRQHGLHQ
jgi:ribosomal protein L29